MAMDTTMMFQSYVLPAIQTIVWMVLSIGGLAALAYYLFVIKRRRKWYVNIWEKKADGQLQMITKDVLFEKRINKGKQLVYMLKRQRSQCFPPSWEATNRIRGKEYCDYLRITDDYIPFKRELKDVHNLPSDTKGIIKKVKLGLKALKTTNKKEIDDRFIHIPVHQTMSAEFNFEAMDYDINMLRINAIDIRDKIYADKQDFLQKYGTFIAFGMIVVLIIVVLYLSYEYSGNVIQAAMGKAAETLSMIEKIAGQMGGTPPPS